MKSRAQRESSAVDTHTEHLHPHRNIQRSRQTKSLVLGWAAEAFCFEPDGTRVNACDAFRGLLLSVFPCDRMTLEQCQWVCDHGCALQQMETERGERGVTGRVGGCRRAPDGGIYDILDERNMTGLCSQPMNHNSNLRCLPRCMAQHCFMCEFIKNSLSFYAQLSLILKNSVSGYEPENRRGHWNIVSSITSKLIPDGHHSAGPFLFWLQRAVEIYS